MVEGLLSLEDDCSLLLARFREYLEHDDIRYHTMQAATDTVGRVTDRHPEVSRLGRVAGGMGRRWLAMAVLRPGLLQVPLTFWNNAFTLLSSVSLPSQERGISSFYVKHGGEHPQAGGQAHEVDCPSPARPLTAAFFTELPRTWKVVHLKVRCTRGVGGLPATKALSRQRQRVWDRKRTSCSSPGLGSCGVPSQGPGPNRGGTPVPGFQTLCGQSQMGCLFAPVGGGSRRDISCVIGNSWIWGCEFLLPQGKGGGSMGSVPSEGRGPGWVPCVFVCGSDPPPPPTVGTQEGFPGDVARLSQT